jgi:hypothetical protein
MGIAGSLLGGGKQGHGNQQSGHSGSGSSGLGGLLGSVLGGGSVSQPSATLSLLRNTDCHAAEQAREE